MSRIILLLIAAFLINGCEQTGTKSVKIIGDTYHKIPTGYSNSPASAARESAQERAIQKEKEIALAKLKSEENLKIAQIEAQNRLEAQEIEAKNTVVVKQIEAKTAEKKVHAQKEINIESQKAQKEIALLQEQRLRENQERDMLIHKLILATIIIIVMLLLLVYYIQQHKNRKHAKELEEERLAHEAKMQASAQQHKKITRVLEIIADKDTNEFVKKELLSIITERAASRETLLIESSLPDNTQTTQSNQINTQENDSNHHS